MTLEGTTRGIAGRRIVIGSVMLAMLSRLLGSTLGIAMPSSILNAALLSRVAAMPSDVRTATGLG